MLKWKKKIRCTFHMRKESILMTSMGLENNEYNCDMLGNEARRGTRTVIFSWRPALKVIYEYLTLTLDSDLYWRNPIDFSQSRV